MPGKIDGQYLNGQLNTIESNATMRSSFVDLAESVPAVIIVSLGLRTDKFLRGIIRLTSDELEGLGHKLLPILSFFIRHCELILEYIESGRTRTEAFASSVGRNRRFVA